MGVDSSCVERVIHFGVPRTMDVFFQESGMGGRLTKSTMTVTLVVTCTLKGCNPLWKTTPNIFFKNI